MEEGVRCRDEVRHSLVTAHARGVGEDVGGAVGVGEAKGQGH